ncbi:MAG TPA: RING finger protein [Planctomycetota bacterium]|nr:RING finger protein [Planctomycetota bacterium]
MSDPVYYGPGETTIGALLAIGVILYLMLRADHKGPTQRKALEAAFYGIAGRLQGKVIPARWPTPPRIEFPVEGHPASLEYNTHETYDGVTQVRVNLKGVSPGMLIIFHDSFRSTLPKLFGAQDIRVGDPQFDHQYVVQANPELLAKRIFAPNRRGDVIGAILRLESLPEPTVHLTREGLTVRARGYLREERELWALSRTALEFTRFVLDLDPVTGVSWGEVRSEEGECRICGSVLAEGHRVVSCSRCRTPHHLECWKYNGRCSTFACGETRFERA